MQDGKKPPVKPWGGRFSGQTDDFVEQFTASLDFDQRLYGEDIQGSQAHARMLMKIGVLSTEECQQILTGLEQIRQEIEQNQFPWRLAFEDVHMNIEARLVEIIGATGKKLHTARSRNDQVATDLRLYVRAQIDIIVAQLRAVQLALLQTAEREAHTLMPGFTHLQVAQPITFGHHLMAWFEMLQRDKTRYLDCRQRLNSCPLGAAALAGTSFPIDRDYTAKLLDFDGPCLNSIDAVADRDFALEFCAASALLMSHLSRFSEELVLWSSAQFDFVELPDRFCTGSSIMPQKKNPDVPELVRGKTGRVYGSLMALLTLMKAQPLAYNKDNQEDKEVLFDCIDTVKQCLKAYALIVPHLTLKKDKLLKAAHQGYATATDLADYLVKKGLPFRDAHEVVGKTVQWAIAHQYDLHQIPLAELQQHSPLIQDDVFQILTLEGSVGARRHIGGTAPEQVLEAIKNARKKLEIP